MIKKLLVAIIAILCIAAIAVAFHGANTTEYSGSNDNGTMVLTLDENTFKLTHEISEKNSYSKTITVYEGVDDSRTFYVNKITTQTFIFGTLVSENISEGMHRNLTEYFFIYDNYVHDGTFIVNGIPLVVKGMTYSKGLACITSEDQYENHTTYTTLLKGSTKADLAELGLIEVYGDGNIVKYDVTADSYGDIDLNTIGVKKVKVTYGDGKTGTMNVEVVDFICEAGPVEPGMTLNQAILAGSLKITPSDITVTSSDWDSTKGDRMVTLTSESGYSKDIFVNFVPSTDKEVVSYELHDFSKYIKQESNIPAFTFDMTLKNGTEYIGISSNDATVTGYDRHTTGPQVLTIYYDKCAFNVALYVYNTEQSIPIAAKLVNNSLTPNISDSKILYDREGVVFSEYAVEVELTNGVMNYIPLTKDMIKTKYDEWIVPGQTNDIDCTLEYYIDGFHYYEDAVITYDPLEQNVKDSLKFSNMIAGCDNISFTIKMNNGAEIIWVADEDKRGFYLAGDMITSSTYESERLVYICADGVHHFDCYLGSATHQFSVSDSIIKNAVMTGKTHTSDGIYNVSYHFVVDEEFIKVFSEFGLKVGEELDFYVIYNFFTMKSSNMVITTQCTVSGFSVYYDPTEVHYSEAVDNFMKQKNTVALTVKYTDGSQRIFDIVIGTKSFNFICDEGHGLYKDAAGTRPYTVPDGGFNVSQTLYYV